MYKVSTPKNIKKRKKSGAAASLSAADIIVSKKHSSKEKSHTNKLHLQPVLSIAQLPTSPA